MDEFLTPFQQIKKLKCQLNPFQELDYIDLTGRSDFGRMCPICVGINKIPEEQFISISEIFNRKEGQNLRFFPPLKHEATRKEIQKLFDENISNNNIEITFAKLREEFETGIRKAKEMAKQQISQYKDIQSQMIQSLLQIEEIEQLKNLTLFGRSEDLNTFQKNEEILNEILRKKNQVLIQRRRLRKLNNLPNLFQNLNCLMKSKSKISLKTQIQ